MNYFLEINHYISQTLNNFILNNHFEKCIGFSSDIPIFFLPIFLVGTWLFWTYKNQNSSLNSFSYLREGEIEKSDLLNIFWGIVLAIIINLIIQHFFFFERPESLITPILKHIPDASFPSDHAAVSFAFLTGLSLAGYKKIGLLYLPFVIIMNTSRIAGGVHWFFDIIAGMSIGIISSIIVFKNKEKLEKINKFIVRIMRYLKL